MNPDRLEYHLKRIGYDKGKTKFLVQGFRNGFRLHHEGDLATKEPNNDISIDQNPTVVQEKLQKEIAEGRLKGPFEVPPFEDFHISPLKLREKTEKGKFRLIHNLSWPYDEGSVNAGIEEEFKTVQYASVTKAIQLIMNHPKGSVTRKTDLKDAFKLIPVHPDDHFKLGMKVMGKYYYDVTLPMGCASACQIFEELSTALEAIHTFYTDQDTLHYLDDFFFIDEGLELAKENKVAFDKLCEDIGIPQAPHKMTMPAWLTQFLGIELDSLDWKATLPLDKVDNYIEEITALLMVNKITQKGLQSVVGKLSFAAAVVPARAFLRRLIEKIYTVKKPHYFIKVTKSMKEDLEMWRRFLASYNGITYFRALNLTTGPSFHMGADASGKGYGAVFGSHWIQERFPVWWQRLFGNKEIGITVLEFYPIYVLVFMFGHLVQNSNIVFHSDNEGVVKIINKQTSHSPYVMAILRPLVLLLIKHNIYLRSVHIEGVKNVLCDRISRFQVTSRMLAEYRMNPRQDRVPQQVSARSFSFK